MEDKRVINENLGPVEKRIEAARAEERARVLSLVVKYLTNPTLAERCDRSCLTKEAANKMLKWVAMDMSGVDVYGVLSDGAVISFDVDEQAYEKIVSLAKKGAL